MKSKLAWPLIFLLFISASYVVGRRQTARAISSSGIVVDEDLEIYGDKNLTQVIDDIDWGPLRPGENESIIIWVQNIGNLNSTIFLYTGNYSSTEAQMYLQLEWNYTAGQVLQPMEAIPIHLNLVVSQNITGIDVFHFDIVISIEWTGERP